MKKETIKQQLLQRITDLAKDDDGIAKLSDILKIYRQECFFPLSQLIQEGAIEFFINRRAKGEAYLKLRESETSEDGSSWDESECLLQTACLYRRIYPDDNIQTFKETIPLTLRNNPILLFISEEKGDLLDLRVLVRCIQRFFEGDNSISISDLFLNKKEMLEIIERIHDNNFILVKQELIEVHQESWGLQLAGGLNQRIIQLLKHKPIERTQTARTMKSRFYSELSWRDIQPCHLYYNRHEKELFEDLSKLMRNEMRKDFPSLSVLLYGKPGTGKTEFAFQLARNIEADIMHLDFSQIQSKYIGETEKNIRKVFEDYRKRNTASDQPTILLMNEADGLMNRRVSMTNGLDGFHNQSQTQLLELLEDFKGIVIATTNLFQSIDEAFHRRFLFRHEMGLPNRHTRELILNNSLLIEYMAENTFQTLLDAEWSPAQLKNVEKKIKQLEKIRVLDESAVENLLFQDGMLVKKRLLGFLQKNDAGALSK
jgi:ATP-dependent 26S proteasome regulatory subunit